MTASVRNTACYGEKAKKIWSNKYIHPFWVSNDTLRLQLTASGRIHVITHSQDLEELFPENELMRVNKRSLVYLPCLFSLEFWLAYVYFTVPVLLCSYL